MGNAGSFNPDSVFQNWTDVADVGLNAIDPIKRSVKETQLRNVCSAIPILDELEKIERGAEIYVHRKIEQHNLHKDDLRQVLPTATEKCLDAMAAAANNDIEPLAASIIIKREQKL